MPAPRAALWLVCLFAASIAVAADDNGLGPAPGLELGGRAAYYRLSDEAVATQGWSGGGQARWFWSQRLAAELSLDYDHRDFGKVHADTYPLLLSLFWYLAPRRRLSPLLLAGGGWYFTYTTGVGQFNNTSNRFDAHAGLGFEAWLCANWSIDATWRYLWAGCRSVANSAASTGPRNTPKRPKTRNPPKMATRPSSARKQIRDMQDWKVSDTSELTAGAGGKPRRRRDRRATF